MKNKYTIITLAIASLAVAANPVMAADKAIKVTVDPTSSLPSSASSGDIARVSKDYLKQITTAQDILGCSVYDGTGEKIGDVKDISLGYKFQSMGGIQVSDKTGDTSPKFAIDDNDEANKNFNSTRDNTRGMGNNSPAPYVFISVGGLMGLGDDVVRVPMSSLSRSDTDKDHLVLQGYSKEKVVAIATQEPTHFDAKDYEHSVGHSDTARAKRVFTDSYDTTEIREALIAEDGLGATAAARIIVGRDGENVILTGSVNTETEKKKAGEIAKKNTKMTVKNEITVKQK